MKSVFFIGILFVLFISILSYSRKNVKEPFMTRRLEMDSALSDINKQILDNKILFNNLVLDIPSEKKLDLRLNKQKPKPTTTNLKISNENRETPNSQPILNEKKINITDFGSKTAVKPEKQSIDLSKYILKTDLNKYQKGIDKDKYILKTEIPKCPTMPNMDKYMLKSSIESCPVGPDMTKYVLKTSIPPQEKCPECDKEKIINAYKKTEALERNAKLQENVDKLEKKPEQPELPDMPEAEDVVLPDDMPVTSEVEENVTVVTDTKENKKEQTKKTSVAKKTTVVKKTNTVKNNIKPENPKKPVKAEMPVKPVVNKLPSHTIKQKPKMFKGSPGQPQTVEQASIVNTDKMLQLTSHHKDINKRLKSEFHIDTKIQPKKIKLEPYDISKTCNLYKRINTQSNVMGPY